MRRLTISSDRERGAISVMAGLLLVVVVGFAAVSIDVAGMWSDRQRLQTAADAAALAVAQDCGSGVCATPAATAQGLVTANVAGAAASFVGATPTVTSTTVTVRAEGVRQHWFAPVLGVDESTVGAQATVTWGPPSGGTSMVPLALSLCEFLHQTGGLASTTPVVITYKDQSGAASGCTGPSGNAVPGGFGWLPVDPGTVCESTTSATGTVGSSTGNSVPAGCPASAMAAIQDQTILLPVFDSVTGTGNNATYRIYAYAAFHVTGYRFSPNTYEWSLGGAPTCSGSDRCIVGYFTRFVDVSEAFEYGVGTPNLGGTIARLTR